MEGSWKAVHLQSMLEGQRRCVLMLAKDGGGLQKQQQASYIHQQGGKAGRQKEPTLSSDFFIPQLPLKDAARSGGRSWTFS